MSTLLTSVAKYILFSPSNFSSSSFVENKILNPINNSLCIPCWKLFYQDLRSTHKYVD
ncbi:hypothetical protein CsatA_022954 [Cannabis sativa]